MPVHAQDYLEYEGRLMLENAKLLHLLGFVRDRLAEQLST